jgi:hypothetical protein
MEHEIRGQDLIEILSLQRNAAMDEVARQAAIIRTMTKKLEERPQQEVIQFPVRPLEDPNESDTRLDRSTG